MSEPKQILVVDDDPSIRKLCLRILRRMGNEAVETGSGGEAVRELETRDHVDAVLLDLNLPDGVGTDWAARIHERHPELPIIYFTGENPIGDMALGNGSNTYYLKKPFTPDAIHSVLAQALG